MLASLEEYLLEKAQALLSLCSPEEAKYASTAFCLTIEDSKGREKFKSAGDYRLPYYPNDTKSVGLSVTARGGNRNMEIEIEFRVGVLQSGAKLSYTGADARDIVEGYAAGVLQRVRLYKSSWFSEVLHPPGVLEFLLLMLFSTACLAAVVYLGVAGLTSKSGGFLVLCAMVVLLRVLTPYSAFPTQRNQARAKYTVHLVSGVILFVVFTLYWDWLKRFVLGW
jgi:hypothetical protein